MSILMTHVEAPSIGRVSEPSAPEQMVAATHRTAVARDVAAVTSNLIVGHETSAEMPLSALQKWLLISRQSLASERFARGDEEADECCDTTRHVARGEMNPAMVGFR
jgi:hypothetical protein